MIVFSEPAEPTRRAVICGCAMIMALAVASPASATTVMGKYEDYGLKFCNLAFECTLILAAVPPGKTLFLNGVSCSIGNGAVASQIVSAMVKGTARPSFLTPIPLVTNPGRRWQSNDRIEKIYPQNSKPSVFTSFDTSAGTIRIECSISGELKP